MNIVDEHMIKLFVSSMESNIDIIDNGLIKLENNKDDQELTNSIMRAAHSLKGSSGLVGFTALKELTHAIESVMVEINNQKIKASRVLISLLLECIDRIKLMREQFLNGNTDIEVKDLMEKLEKAKSGTLDDNKKEKNISDKKAEEKQSANSTPNIVQGIELDAEAMNLFFLDLEEDINRINNGLLELESNPRDMNLINGIMRSAHNIKGSSGMVGFITMKKITHAVESLMQEISNQKLTVTRQVISLLLECIDRIKLMKENFQNGNTNTEISDLLEKLNEIKTQSGNSELEGKNIADIKKAESKEKINVEIPKEKLENIQNIKIRVSSIENMINQISELILYQKQLWQINKVLKRQYIKEPKVKESLQILEDVGQITKRLQDELMQSKMISMEVVFKNFPRMVRDLEMSLNKNIKLLIENSETRLDKNIAEEISNPLIHIIRNSADHGIELPEERVKAGKTENGTIKISTWQQSEQIIVSVEDDGAGIDKEKVLNSAIKKGLITEEKAKEFTKREAINLIFHPGFSTANTVSEVSGRGVGMDVVKTHIEKINGTIELDTDKGKGTKITLKIPSTMSIIPCIITEINGKNVCLPSINVNTALKITDNDIQKKEDREIILIDGVSIPLVRLHKKFSKMPKEYRGSFYAVVIGLAEKRLAILVDRLLGSQKIIIKPLSKFLGEIKDIAGATILEDGEIGMVLNISQIIAENYSSL